MTYAELIGGRYFNVQLDWNKKYGNPLYAPGKAQPKKPSDYKIVGQPIKREDVAPKVFAQENFVTDVKVPGMVHGRMIRPAVAGAVPVKVDDSSIKDIPGAKVVWDKGFLGVVADKEWDAIQAAEKLKVEWSHGAAAVPGAGQALRPHPQGAGAQARGAKNRTAMSRRPSRRAAQGHRGGIRMAVPVACQHGPGLRAGRDQGRQGDAAGAGRRSPHFVQRGLARDARRAGRQGARDLGDGPRLLWPQRRRRRRAWTPRCWPRRSAGRCGCNTCATRAPAGTRRARPRSTRRAPALDASGKVIAYEF